MGRVVLGVELQEPIGNGPVSTVYRAALDDGTPVAVKVFELRRAMDRGLDGDLALVDFAESVDATLRASEAADAQLIGVRKREEDRTAVMYDLAANGNMADLPALGWDEAQCTAFFVRLCDAVQWAHGRDVVHGNLKPSNVLLDDDLHPRLTDFGRTEVDGIYAAPEADVSADVRSDVFSLGRLLQFMLTGEEPLPLAGDRERLEELEGLSSGIRRIVRKCILRDPDARYQSVETLLADVARAEGDLTVGVAYKAAGAASFAPPKRVEKEVAVEPSRRTAPDGGTAKKTPSLEMSSKVLRRIELGVVAAGGLLAVGAMALLLSGVPTDAESFGARVAAAVGVGLLAFGVPAASRRLNVMRIVLGVALAVVVFMLDASKVEQRALGVAAKSGTVDEKRAAVQRLLGSHGSRQFPGMDLQKVDLNGLNFENAQLSGANLTGANCAGANFYAARLEGADVTGADFSGAILLGSTASQATGFSATRCSERTAMPEGFKCEAGKPVSASVEP